MPLFNVYVDVCLQVKANNEAQAKTLARQQFEQMLHDGKVTFMVNEMYYDEPEPVILPPTLPDSSSSVTQTVKKKSTRPRKRVSG